VAIVAAAFPFNGFSGYARNVRWTISAVAAYALIAIVVWATQLWWLVHHPAPGSGGIGAVSVTLALFALEFGATGVVTGLAFRLARAVRGH